jgi:hypothetical protein
VKKEANQAQAKDHCLKHGMQLYQTESSFAAFETIAGFTQRAFGGSSKAVAYIESSNEGKCSTFSGNAKTSFTSCAPSYTFFCEYLDIAAPLTDYCSFRNRVIGSDENFLQKYYCMITKALAYEPAEKLCRSIGMELFVVESAEVMNSLAQTASSFFPSNQMTRYWINGKKDESGNWFTYSPKKNPLFPLVSFTF